MKLAQAMQVLVLVLFRKLDHQQRLGITAYGGIDHGPEHRDGAAEADHGAIHQFNRDRLQLHQMLGGVHRLVEAAEVADADRAVTDHRPQLQLDLRGEGQRPFGADEQMRKVVRPVGWDQRIEIVAADAPLHLRKTGRDLGGLARAERQHIPRQHGGRIVRRDRRIILCDRSEIHHVAVGERRAHCQRIVAHGAVAQRTAAAGIVAGHAADGGARRGGDIDRKPQPVFFQLAVQVVEHDAGFDHAGSRLDIERQDLVEVLGDVDDNAAVDRLAALRGAAAARGDDAASLARDGHRAQRIVHRARHHHAAWHDLIE